MAWLSSTPTGINIHKSYRRQKVFDRSWGSWAHPQIYQNVKVVTTEYRGLTNSQADQIVDDGITNTMTNLAKDYTVNGNETWHATLADAYGTITERSKSRANEAGGYTVVVTETTTQAQVYWNGALLETLGTL